MKHTTKNCEVTYDDSIEAKACVFDAVIAFFIKHEAFDGETCSQSDRVILDCYDFLSELTDDIIKFDVHWNEKE